MRTEKKALQIVLVAAVVVLASVAYGDTDLVSTLAAQGWVNAPEISFSWNAMFHQDTFVTSDLLGAPVPASSFKTGLGGYFVVGRPEDHSTGNPTYLDATDRMVTYGAGNITVVNEGMWGPGTRCQMDLSTNIKIAMGNLTASRVELISAGDTEVQGTANAVDSLTGVSLVVPASKFVDSGHDGIIIYKTYFDLTVRPGTDLYYDFNRDGVISNAALDGSVAARLSDRPFLALYETDSTTSPTINLDSPAASNPDGDSSRTDNLWVGNPYAPVNADNFIGDPRGTDGPSPNAEADPSITDTGSFNDPLLVGEIKNLYFITVINLWPGAKSSVFMFADVGFNLAGTDGRLYDWAQSIWPNPATFHLNAALNASLIFDLGRLPQMIYEYYDDGTLILEATIPVPEPAGLVLVLGSLAGLLLNRRRK